jgi:predicted metal-dependent peptidase
VYRTKVNTQAKANRIRPATRQRGLARKDSKVRDGSKKMPVRVSAVDISGPVVAGALGTAIGSLIDILLRKNGRV